MAKKVSIIERRLQGKSALDVPSLPIPIKEKSWTLMWFNGDIGPDHVWNAVNVLGWEYVTPIDLECTVEEIGAGERDGKVVRGERGKEILLKMRTSDYKKVQAKKDKENKHSTFDRRKIKDATLNAVGSEFGSEAADFVNKANITVQDSREHLGNDD